MHTTISTLYQGLELTSDIDYVRAIISEQVKGGYSFIEYALGDFIKSDGKMLRPAFLILTSRFGDVEESGMEEGENHKFEAHTPRDAHQLAAAVELLHMATLVHDDIIDHSGTRRGKPTLNALHGDRKAVLLGDYLFSRSFSLATKHTDLKTGGYISQIVGSICDSELRQNDGTYGFSICFKEYHRRIMGKTAALFAVSCYVGAVEAELDERNTVRLKKIGYNLGAAFQIIDDIIDCSLTSDGTGKLSGNDIKEGVVNLPILFALREDSDGSLKKMLEKPPRSSKKLRKTIELIRDLGGVEKSKEIAWRFLDKAKTSIDLLPDKPARRQLDQLAGFLVKRNY